MQFTSMPTDRNYGDIRSKLGAKNKRRVLKIEGILKVTQITTL